MKTKNWCLESEENGKSAILQPKSWYGARHTQVLMLFFLTAITFGKRVNLSVAIVAMTTPNTSANCDIPTYKWTDHSIILSSYFWGYVLPQVMAGQLAERFGPKWFITGASTVSLLCTFLIPTMAQFGSWAVILFRVLQGFCHGFFTPSCHCLLAKWSPGPEKSRLNTFVYSAGPLGIVFSMCFTGWISGTWLGWPFSFYGHGIAALLWTIAWIFIGKNSPSDHNSIDIEEIRYIQQSSGVSQNKQHVATPWKSVVTSLPVWAILVSTCGQLWGFSTLLTNIPLFLAHILGYHITKNGLLSAGPYLVFWILSLLFSSLADYVITRKLLSVCFTRKLMTSIGMYIPGICLLALALMSTFNADDATATLVILFLAVGVSSAFLSGYQVNHIDIAPTYAGTLMGITNGFGNIFSIIGPLSLQFIVTEQDNVKQWATAFYIASANYIIGNTFYIIFASGVIQPWNSNRQESHNLEVFSKN